MCQIAEEHTFADLSVTKFENVQWSCDFIKVSQEVKNVTFISAWQFCVVAMSFGHRGCLTKLPKNDRFFLTYFDFL